jgi:hypothetical protein
VPRAGDRAAVLVVAIGGLAALKLIGSGEASATQPKAEPGGRADMRSVFPSLDSTCREAVPNPTNEEVAAFDCNYGEYFVRYAYWKTAAGANGYLTKNYGPGHGNQSQWFVHGSPEGTMWVATASNKDPDLPYVWAAAYQNDPYTVTVKAEDTESREAAKTMVTAVTADHFHVDG